MIPITANHRQKIQPPRYCTAIATAHMPTVSTVIASQPKGRSSLGTVPSFPLVNYLIVSGLNCFDEPIQHRGCINPSTIALTRVEQLVTVFMSCPDTGLVLAGIQLKRDFQTYLLTLTSHCTCRETLPVSNATNPATPGERLKPATATSHRRRR